MPNVFVVAPDCEPALEAVELIERNDASARYATTTDEALTELQQTGTDILLVFTEVIDGSPVDFLLGMSPRLAKRVILCGPENGLAETLKGMQSEMVGYLPLPLNDQAIHDLLRTEASTREKLKKRSKSAKQHNLNAEHLDDLLLGISKPIKRVRELIGKVAPTEATVLVVGDSGTGKELVAQGIHHCSSRKGKAFEAINCGAIPENLMESELFGHMKGSFTGATRNRKGIFERANCGTLFLDEVTEMAPEMQVRLLRVLETMTLRRVGGEKEFSVDVRVIAATNRNPEQAVREGKLREDLMYRLAVFQIDVPPLHQRDDDAVLLANEFLAELNNVNGTAKNFSDVAVKRLRSYHWPGNVRQLRNVVNRGYILANEKIDLSYLQKLIRRAKSETAEQVKYRVDAEAVPIEVAAKSPITVNEPAVPDVEEAVVLEVGTTIDEAQRELILRTLDELDGDKKQAAKVLGISLKTLYNRINQYESEGHTTINSESPAEAVSLDDG